MKLFNAYSPPGGLKSTPCNLCLNLCMWLAPRLAPFWRYPFIATIYSSWQVQVPILLQKSRPTFREEEHGQNWFHLAQKLMLLQAALTHVPARVFGQNTLVKVPDRVFGQITAFTQIQYIFILTLFSSQYWPTPMYRKFCNIYFSYSWTKFITVSLLFSYNNLQKKMLSSEMKIHPPILL